VDSICCPDSEFSDDDDDDNIPHCMRNNVL
jgi:hypothetical protein